MLLICVIFNCILAPRTGKSSDRIKEPPFSDVMQAISRQQRPVTTRTNPSELTPLTTTPSQRKMPEICLHSHPYGRLNRSVDFGGGSADRRGMMPSRRQTENDFMTRTNDSATHSRLSSTKSKCVTLKTFPSSPSLSTSTSTSSNRKGRTSRRAAARKQQVKRGLSVQVLCNPIE